MVVTPPASPPNESASGLVVCAVTVRDDKVLLLRRSKREKFLPGNWVLPAGKVRADEDHKVAVLRELREEAGLEGEVITPLGTSAFQSVYLGRPTEWTQLNYLVRPDGAEVTFLDGSHCDHRWTPLKARGLFSLLADDFTVGVVDQACSQL